MFSTLRYRVFGSLYRATTAVNTCECYYQAFQYLLWAGKSPREAIETALFETRGEA